MTKKWFLPFLFLGFVLVLSPWGWTEEGEQKSAVVIRTPAAEYDEKTGKIVAQNSTIEWQGIKVVCPSIEVDTGAQEVRSSGNIDITWEDFKARAQSLFYKRSDNVLVMSSVSGGNAGLRFSAQKMNLDFTREVILLTGEPTFQTRDLNLQAQEVEYFLKDKIWQAQKVDLAKGEWKGKAQKARYNPAEQYVILEEQAQVWKGENILRGTRIRIYLDTGQVKVEGDVEINILP
jgi:lipopolysaccharide export system protein LptA